MLFTYFKNSELSTVSLEEKNLSIFYSNSNIVLVNKMVPYEVDEEGNVLKREVKQEPANGDKEKELLKRFQHANI